MVNWARERRICQDKNEDRRVNDSDIGREGELATDHLQDMCI